MKNLLIFLIVLLLAVFATFKLAYWLGFETARIQADFRDAPPIEYQVKGSYYNQYLLKNCLIENRVLKGGEKSE